MGKWLHRTLERFHLPASLNGREKLPKNLRPIFRDEEELSATDLPEQIITALKNSNNLVVICSPNSAKSKWVNDEITFFIGLENDRLNKVFPFIVEGTPETSYPEILLQHNFPKNRLAGSVVDSGKRNATLKIIAGMLGVKFDELKRRARRQRIIKTVFYSCLAILVTSIILVISNIARKAYVKNLMDNAKIAYEQRDFTAFSQLAAKAYSWDFHSEQTRALLLKATAIDYAQPIKLEKSCLQFNSRTHEYYEYDDDKKQYFVRDASLHKTGEQISFTDSWNYPISSSPDGHLLAIPDYDSVYVYDRVKRAFIFSTPYDGGWLDNLGEIVFNDQGKLMVRLRPRDVLIHDLEEKITLPISCSYKTLFLSDSYICLARVLPDSLFIDRIDPLTREISVYKQWVLPPDSYEHIRESLTVSPNGKELVAWTGNSVVCFNEEGIEYIVYSDRKPSHITYDYKSERLAIIHGGGSYVQVFRNHRLEYGFYGFYNKPINAVIWGHDEDLILHCGEQIFVYNPVSKLRIALDASLCPTYSFTNPEIYSDSDYIVLSDGVVASNYAVFTYPNLEWVTNHYPSPKYVSDYFEYTVDAKGQSFEYADIDRRVFCEKDRIVVLSMSDNRPISEIAYPPSDSFILVSVSRTDNLLLCNLRSILPSDTGSVKGLSFFYLIDLENGKMVSDYSRNGCYNHLIDSGYIILSAQEDYGAIIKLEMDSLHPVDSLSLGEFISMPPIKCADGSYLTVTEKGHLFHYDFSSRHVKTIPLPFPAVVRNNFIFDGRYLRLHESSQNRDGDYLYDLKSKSLVLYLLPGEHIVSLDGDNVFIETYNNNQHLSYSRKLLNKRDISHDIETFPE